ncbi:MAG TPA: ATP-binding protein [Candidatus Binatia bacterium]|jgi:two-component system phosphate regulon sensor histidine kinase PhoR|nr:ATP-binding protein [Candidatus Binatia bacterium]
MRWRNSVLFLIVLFPLLAVCVLAGLLLLSYLPLFSRFLLWYGFLLVGLAALLGAFLFGLRLHHRLKNLYEFVTTPPQRNLPPSLPVWGEDEVGALERGLQQLVFRHREQTRALQSEGKKLEAVLQSMAEGVVVVDPAGNVVLCNRTAQELFSLHPTRDWRGKPLQAFSRHPMLQDLLREVANRRPSDPPVTREIETEGKTRRYLAVSAMQVSEEGATVSGYVFVFHDLTQLKRLESVRADFVANVSHELRTPLTAIKGYAETLLNGALKDPDTATRFLTIIDRHSERLSRLIDDLLTLSNLELGTTELRRDEIALAELTSEVFEVVKNKAEQGGVRLVQEFPPELPMLLGDNDRLQQVLLNLIDNAIKYTPAGGTVAVTAKTVQSPESGVRSLESGEQSPRETNSDTGLKEEWIEVAVADTGCGIPEAEIPRLTQRFYRVDKARSRELGGTGLGLAIVKHIVQAHDGSLQIESQLNRGTTVRLFFPLSGPHSESAPSLAVVAN